MIIKYDEKIYASWDEDCYTDDGVEDIDQLLSDMEGNADIDTYKTTHYMVECTYIGDDDNWGETLDKLLEQQRYGYYVPIEVIKE